MENNDINIECRLPKTILEQFEIDPKQTSDNKQTSNQKVMKKEHEKLENEVLEMNTLITDMKQILDR